MLEGMGAAVHHIENTVICAAHDIVSDTPARVSAHRAATGVSDFQRELMELEACDRARAC